MSSSVKAGFSVEILETRALIGLPDRKGPYDTVRRNEDQPPDSPLKSFMAQTLRRGL